MLTGAPLLPLLPLLVPLLLHLAGLEDELLLLLAAIVAASRGLLATMADEAEMLVDEDEMMLLDEIPVVDKLDLSSWWDRFLYPFTLSTRFLDLSMNPELSLRLLETQEPISLVKLLLLLLLLLSLLF